MANADVVFDRDAQVGNLPLYFAMLCYLCIIGGVGIVAKRWKEEAAKKSQVEAQFGGEFSVGLVILTTFSSVFSGYTVIGVPGEASRQGFTSMRWLTAILGITFGMMVYFPRLRRMYIVRGYYSPNDFLADRYRSPMITIFGSICTCAPQLLYLCVQLVSFASLLNGLTAGLIPNWVGLILFSVIVLVLEKVGGMNSVVLSDAIQAGFMLFGFVCVFLVVSSQFGSLAALSSDDCQIQAVDDTNWQMLNDTKDFDTTPDLCTDPPGANDSCVEFGCIAAIADGFGGRSKSSYFWFLFNMGAFALNPHMVQRASISKADTGVRTTIQVLCFAAFVTMIPGIILGITTTVFRKSWPLSAGHPDVGAFSATSNFLKDQGALLYALVTMLTCSALAAIMSTADSVILGVSNTLSIDIYKGLLRPTAPPEAVVSVGNWISVIFTLIGVVYSWLYVDSKGFGTLLTIQNGILLNIVPAFVFGLYVEEVHTKAILGGLASGLGLLLVLVFGYGSTYTFSLPGTEIPFIPVVNLCALLNVAVTLSLNVKLRGSGPTAPEEATTVFGQNVKNRFGSPLKLSDIEQAFEGDRLPGGAMYGAALFFILLSFPWFFDIESVVIPPWAQFIGFPPWAIYVLVMSLIGSCVLFSVAMQWQPCETPPIRKEDPELELTAVRAKASRNSVM